MVTIDRSKISAVTELPEDDTEFMVQFARAAMMHAHLDNALLMMLMDFNGSTMEDVILYTGYRGAKHMREDIEGFAVEQFGNGDALDTVRDLMSRCGVISFTRNELLHSPIAYDRTHKRFMVRLKINGQHVLWGPLPHVKRLRELADLTLRLVNDIHHERKLGTIASALAARVNPPKGKPQRRKPAKKRP